MKFIVFILALFAAESAMAGASPTSQTYGATQVDKFRNGTPGMMIFKGQDDNQAYMVQGNPDTGALLVDGEFSIDILAQGENGEPIPDYSLLMGGNSSGDLIPIKVDADGTVDVSGEMVVSGTVAATQSGTWTVQPGNTANTTPWLTTISQGGNSATVSGAGALKVDASASTQPISGTVAATQSGTWNITNISGTVSLPTGAATEATLASVESDTSSIDTKTPALGQAAMAASAPVVIASNQSAVPVTSGNLPATVATNAGANDASTLRVTEGSRSYSDSARYNYAGGTVNTSDWTEVDASTAAAINYLCITDQSGQIMELGTGAAAAETRVFMIARGFSGCIPLRVAASTRIAVRAISASATTGDLVISGMQ